MTARVQQIFVLVVALIGFVLDRTLKWYISSALPPQGVALFPGLAFERFENTGLIFSLAGNRTALVVSIAAYVILALYAVAQMVKMRGIERDARWAGVVALVALGGASNVWDRFAHQSVTDYLIIFSRSAINFADIMILAGMVSAVHLLHARHKPKAVMS